MSSQPQNQRSLDSGRFLSLKWKIMLTLSTVLLTVNGAVSWLAYQDQIAGFAERRAVLRERHLSEALSLQQDSAQHMQRLADMMASIVGMSGFSRAADVQSLAKDTLDPYAAALQLNLNVDAMRFYDAQGRLLSGLSASLGDGTRETARVGSVLMQEKSLVWLDCAQECVHSAAAPILAHGRLAGAVVVTGLLADMIVSFYRLTGVDIGLLSPMQGMADDMALPALGMRVAGLSGMDANLPLLKQLTRLPAEKDGKGWHELQYAGRNYELAFVRVDAAADNSKAPLLVVLEDVSDEYARIRSLALWQLAGNVSTSLLALLLLAFLLNNPLGRMMRAAQAIPLLGQHAFDEIRARLRPRTGIVLWDEIDHLDRAAVTLSKRLEDLEREERQHTEKMQEVLQRISVERDFNQGLLDTAQVIILTQTGSGNILTINRYGENLTGWSEAELQGKAFYGTICRARPGEEDMTGVLQEVADGRQDIHTHECTLVRRDGGDRAVVWSHTLLVEVAGQDAQVLSVGVDITERKRAESRLAYLAEHDPLTGLANRQHFQRKLEQALAVARRSGRGGALLYLDLDGFKYVNDVSGHQAGDALLRMVAEELVACMRDIDLVGRLGGDEMGILLQECDAAGAMVVADKISQRLEKLKFPGLGTSHRVSASIGIVLFPTAGADVKQILANADIAMYQAKADGRARCHLYAEGERMQEKLQRWVHWEERIKKALEEDGFVMYYQPILDIHNGRISHYEALLRMRGEDGNLIAPGEFMEVAEESGLIREIDRYVVTQVITRLNGLLKEGKTYKFAINLSGVSINDEGLLDFLRHELARHPDVPQHLIFEITETAAVSDFAAARIFMQAVRELGCVFSLDDFGVGFSSFYYVKHLPVDYVKIDGSFIRNLADSPDDQVFVRALAEVARGFGKKTVAEFVENERILALLRAFGVDYAQGYFIGKPSEQIGP